MKIIKGRFVNKCPVIKTGVAKSGKLVLGRGRNLIVVDSGFDSDISVPPKVLNLLNREYAGNMPFQLADGTEVWKDLWAGIVVLGDYEHEALFIEGDYLLGMDLTADLFSYFLLDFDNQKVELKVKK